MSCHKTFSKYLEKSSKKKRSIFESLRPKISPAEAEKHVRDCLHWYYGNKATFETTWMQSVKWETAELDYL